MKTSQNGIAFITREEGVVLHVYNDSGGKATIGIGHLLGPGESYPNGITLQQAQAMLANDLARFEATINACVKVPLSQNSFDALCSFSYNLGAGALTSSTLLKLLNAGDFNGAANEFPKWDKVNGKPDAEILGRRNRERALFLTPDAAPVAPTSPPPVPQPPVAPSAPVTPVAPPPVSAPMAPAQANPFQAIIDFIVMLAKLFTGNK